MAQNVVIIGGSYVGLNLAESIAAASKGRFRVLLIEKNSHFQHLFSFPRYALTTAVPTHKAFIPFKASRLGQNGAFLQAAVVGLTKNAVQLDRKVLLDGEQIDEISYSALAIATGTKLSPCSTLPVSEKLDGVAYLRKHAAQVEGSSRIVVIGAGAVGVQTAIDIKQLYPSKSVTLVHSRENVMSKFHPELHQVVKSRCAELGIEMVLGSRVQLPAEGYPTDGRDFAVRLQNGREIPADFAIICTGQTPQSALLRSLSPESIDAQGFIKVKDTLQIADDRFPNIFALGDIAATAAHKAARPAIKQADVVSKNITHLDNREPLEKYQVTDPAAIHLTLGIEKSVIFRNPSLASEGKPVIMHKDDGTLDMNIDSVWARRGADVSEAML